MVRLIPRNPLAAQRFSLGVIAFGGLVAGIGTLVRASSTTNDDQWTFLLDTVGLVVALVGGGLDFRTQLLFGEFEAAATKRRGIILLLFGAVAGLGGCVSLGWMTSDNTPAVVQGFLATLVTAGIGAGLAGLLNIGWFGGGDYLERRIEQKSSEEW